MGEDENWVRGSRVAGVDENPRPPHPRLYRIWRSTGRMGSKPRNADSPVVAVVRS